MNARSRKENLIPKDTLKSLTVEAKAKNQQNVLARKASVKENVNSKPRTNSMS